MQKGFLILAASVVLLVGATVASAGPLDPAPANLMIQYDIPPNSGTNAGGATATNTGVLGTAGNGTFVNGSTAVTGPDALTGMHFDDGAGGGSNLGTGIISAATLGQVSQGGTQFTAGAWVNLDNENGDNMVFGTNGGSPMHLGFRGGQAYFGFWGNDSNQTPTADPTGSWHYFTWVYNSANNGEQSIYEDGQLLGSSFGHNPPGQTGEQLTVATNGGNGGDLAGSIDDARVYNIGMNGGQVAQLYKDSALSDAPATPEPATLTLAGFGALGLLGYARRRKVASAA